MNRLVSTALVALTLASAGDEPMARGRELLGAGDPAAAERVLRDLLASMSSAGSPPAALAEAEVWLAHSIFAQGRQDEARALLASALSRRADLVLDPTLHPRGLIRILEAVRTGGRIDTTTSEGEPRARAARLIPALAHDNPVIREAAEDDLVRIGEPAIPLLRLALRDDNARIRYGVVRALDRVGALEQGDTPALLLHSDAPALRKTTADALARSASSGAAAVLARLLDDPDAEVRSNAASALPGVLARLRPRVAIGHQPVGCLMEGKFARLQAAVRPAHLRARVIFKSKSGSSGYFYSWMLERGERLEGYTPKPSRAAAPISYYIEATAFDPAMRSLSRLPRVLRERLEDANVLARTPETMVDVVDAPGSCPSGLTLADTGTPPAGLTFYPADDPAR